MQLGNRQRTVGATALNQDSSRSHSIFCVAVEQTVASQDQAQSLLVAQHMIR